jgi:dethiobiotin synthetase
VKRILFVTGTDTGVGKTLLTAMLVCHLRQSGVNALAMKPFCSGGMDDVELLGAAQDGALTRKEINPFYFTKPLAPLVAARKSVPLQSVLNAIKALSARCETLVVEGAGGVLVPLGKDYFVVDLIAALNCEVILVARNKLGTINHTLLSQEAIRKRGVNSNARIVLMGQARPDLSARTNAAVLEKLLNNAELNVFPYLGANAGRVQDMRVHCTKLKKLLARVARHT